MKFLVYGAVFAGAFVAFSLVSFWLAVRPPRLAIPLVPGDYGLTVETVTISADDGVRLAAWLLPRAGAPALVLLHGYPAEKADLLPIAAAPTPSQNRSSGARSAHGATMMTRPARVTSDPAAMGAVTGSSRKTAAIAAAPSG